MTRRLARRPATDHKIFSCFPAQIRGRPGLPWTMVRHEKPRSTAEVTTKPRRTSMLINTRRALLRPTGLILALTAAAVLAAGSHGATRAHTHPITPSRSWVSGFESNLIGRINLLRRAHQLAALEPSRALSAVAREHDEQMIRFGYFGHASPDGSPFWLRVMLRYPPHLRHRWAVGENLLSATPDVSPQGALTAWLTSPEHRATLMSPGWRTIGLVVLHVGSAPGVFHSRPTTVVTADFGVRS